MTSTTTAMVQDSISKFLDRAQHENFDTLALEYGLVPRETRVVKDRPVNFPGLYAVSQLQDFALQAKIKDLSEPLRGRGGYYLFRLEGIEPAGSQPFDRVKQMIEWKIKRDKEKDKIKPIAEEAFKKIFAGKSFADIVKEDTTVELHQDTFVSFTRCKSAKGPEFAGALYALKPNETSGVISVDWGSFIIHCDERKEAENIVADDFRNQRQEAIVSRIFSDVLKIPEVADFRNAFLY